MKKLNETGYVKIPPQAVEVEEAVIGAMMLERDALITVVDIIHSETFYKQKHQTIYKAIQKLFNANESVDILTVTQKLKEMGKLGEVGGAYYITQLTNGISSAANIEYHARILIQKAIQRQLIYTGSIITKEGYEDTNDVFELLDMAEQRLFKISEMNFRGNYNNMRALVNESLKRIEEAANNEGKLIGLPSGFTDVDRITSGWQKTDLIILAARPGMGKTAMALTMARSVAIEFEKTVAVFSLEMGAIQLTTRLIASETRIVASKLKQGDLDQADWAIIHQRINKLIDSNIIIDDTPGLSIMELRAKCRRLKAKQNVDMIVVDYIQLMDGERGKTENREQEISRISRSLKNIAKELDVPVIALSQLSREVEKRSNKRPQLSDLRESGAIEQDSDIVLFLYRPEYYNILEDENGKDMQGVAELNIAKHRNGSMGIVKLNFEAEYTTFSDLEEEKNYYHYDRWGEREDLF